MDDNFMWSAGITLCEMRLIIEGAVDVYEEGASPLASIAKKNGQYEAASALETIGSALFSLRAHIRALQASHIQSVSADERA